MESREARARLETLRQGRDSVVTVAAIMQEIVDTPGLEDVRDIERCNAASAL